MKLDSADRKILRQLQAEGRLPNVELASRVGLSESPCLRRVRRLESGGVIKGYRAEVDPRKLGLDIIAFILVNLNQTSEADSEKFFAAVQREPSIIECHAMTGNYDYLLKVAAANLEAFADIAMQRILHFPGVSGISTGFVLKAVKTGGGLPVERLPVPGE